MGVIPKCLHEQVRKTFMVLFFMKNKQKFSSLTHPIASFPEVINKLGIRQKFNNKILKINNVSYR